MKSIRTILISVVLIFSYSLPAFSKTIVVSDIDDTLKKANSMGRPTESAYHFLRKIPYFFMRDLFVEMKSHHEKEGISFYYVSAAPQSIFDADEWIKKNKFPVGLSVLKNKTNKAPTYEYKHAVIKALIEKERQEAPGEKLTVMMFGDNSQYDAVVYADLTREMNLDSKIFIRDVRAEATYFDQNVPVVKLKGVHYFFSEVELFREADFNYLSQSLVTNAYTAYKSKKLIPDYTLKTLDRRLESLYSDPVKADIDSIKFWNDYYSRL